MIRGSYNKLSSEPACGLLFLMNGSNPKLFSLVSPKTPWVPSFPPGTSSPIPLPCSEMGRKGGCWVPGEDSCCCSGGHRDAAWVYLELFLAVPGPQASRISASQLSRKPGLSAAKQDKNSFSCLLTELGKGAGYLPSPYYSIFVSCSLGTGPE